MGYGQDPSEHMRYGKKRDHSDASDQNSNFLHQKSPDFSELVLRGTRDPSFVGYGQDPSEHMRYGRKHKRGHLDSEYLRYGWDRVSIPKYPQFYEGYMRYGRNV